MVRQEFEQPRRGDGGRVLNQHAGAVLGYHGEEIARRRHGLVGDGGDAIEEEVCPAFPVTLGAHRIQPPVVFLASDLRVSAPPAAGIRPRSSSRQMPSPSPAISGSMISSRIRAIR